MTRRRMYQVTVTYKAANGAREATEVVPVFAKSKASAERVAKQFYTRGDRVVKTAKCVPSK